MKERLALLLALRHQVEAMRLHLDAAIALEDGEGLLDDGEEREASGEEGCQHPRDDREPSPVSGKPRQFVCKGCMTLVDPDAPVTTEEGEGDHGS